MGGSLNDLQFREVDVSVLRLRPDDVLAFRSSIFLDKDQMAYLRDRIREEMVRAGLQDTKFMLINGMDISIVRDEK